MLRAYLLALALASSVPQVHLFGNTFNASILHRLDNRLNL